MNLSDSQRHPGAFDGVDRLSPSELRRRFRRGLEVPTTAGLARGYVQMSLTILPEKAVEDFVGFAEANRRAMPVLAVLPAGAWSPTEFAEDADLRRDLPAYRVYRHGRAMEDVSEIVGLWRDDLVCIMSGCSYTFEEALEDAGIRLTNLATGSGPAIYRTSWPCVPHGPYAAPLVVTMRPIPREDVARAIEATSRYPDFHGEPVHVGDPAELGIVDLRDVDYGGAPTLQADEVPLFWACNVTRHIALQNAGVPFAITNAPSRMFVTDVPRSSFERGSPLSGRRLGGER